ncbi:hypothetical protein, partial [Vibrio lentus]|uniref:capsular polysaccharide export protein, LipB/KpsS family n=1 Tax=Vibrio lentus TaxID=136468 RepID=UPI003D098760
SIYGDSDIFNKIKEECYSNKEIAEIFERFLLLKRKQLTIPQKSGGFLSKLLKGLLFNLDTLIQLVTNVYSDRRVKINIKTRNSKNRMEVDFTQLSSIDDFDNCIFFPLQVSTDQQVLINYRGGSIEAAIKEVIAYANMNNLTLVLKDHPGEHNKENIRKLVESICRHSGVRYLWVNARVPCILDKIHRVITINSTVGLEALINGNDVKFIGDSVYNGMTKQELAKYLNDYLVPVDYQIDTTICADLVNKILLRA